MWLGITAALGLVFLAGQGSEYVRLFHQGVTMSQGLFGTTFFTLTGVHGLHLIVGLLLLAVVADRQVVALYWYFVGAVWLVIFAVVYLWSFA